MHRFTQIISIVGVNPCVTVPLKIAKTFGKKGFIPVRIKVNGHPFLANLVPVGGTGFIFTASCERRPWLR
jgi:hypothetical protein